MTLYDISVRNKTFIATIVSFVFYFTWTLWVNSLVSADQILILRSALMQGTYSALMTASFTAVLSLTLARIKFHNMPYLAIIPPLILQCSFVYIINMLNQTPSLLATIAPSIFFTTLYGIFYTHNFLKRLNLSVQLN
jgi:hypothetical protein